MPTPNRNIPYVPEGTLNPAAGLNLSLNFIDALLQTAVIAIDLTAPPGSPTDGDLYIVAGIGGTATGAWTGHEDDLARYVSEGNSWQFFEAGSEVVIVLNMEDGGLYAYAVNDSSPSWQPAVAGGASSAPIIQMSASDLITDLIAATSVAYCRAPRAMTLTAVRASLIDASSSGAVTVDINVNGSTILSTKLTIDATETTSVTAATPAVISSPGINDDDLITIDIDGAGTDAKGLIVTLIG